jgi:hypothetical protein
MAAEPDREVVPKTQTETSGSSGDGRYPPSRTAVGAADGGGPQYSLEETLQCEVVGFRDGGFEVLILRDGNKAFLKTDRSCKLGEIVLARFQKWQDRQR